jgi:DNA invertase Pin-like site-specific DNA recombinase
MIIGFGFHSQGGKGPQGDRHELEKAGCERIILVVDALEAKFKLDEVLQYTRDGDVLLVLALDRLGNTLDEIVRTAGRLCEQKIALHVIGCVSPGTPVGDSFVEVCHLLSKQSELFRQSRAASSERPLDAQPRRGRPGSLSGLEQERAMRMLSDGRANVREVARLFKVSPATIYRLFPRRRPTSASQRVPEPIG